MPRPTGLPVAGPFALAMLPALQPLFLLALALPALALPSPDLVVRKEAGRSELWVGTTRLVETGAEIVEARSLAVPGARVAVVLWTERAPDGTRAGRYAVSFDGASYSRVRPARNRLALKRASFDPLEGTPDLSTSPLAGGGNVYLVQFHTQSLAAYRDELARLGCDVRHFLPYQAHLVRMSRTQAERVRALEFVRWVGEYHPEYRLEPAILVDLRSGTPLDEAVYNVQVFEKGPAEKRVVAERIAALGGEVVASIPHGYLLQARLTEQHLRQVAGWDEVVWIDRWQPPATDMDKVRVDGGANLVEANGGFTGSGVAGEAFDTGVLAGHGDFQSNPPLIHNGNSSDTSHGTSVAGIVFGDGSGNGTARGLLPDGTHVFASFYNLSDRYAHTAQLLQPPYEAVFQTNSWGSGLTTDYTSVSMELDDVVFDHEIVIVQSQSNTGSQDSRPQAWSKNVVSVGGIRHFNTQSTADDAWQGAGSIGPAADGRVKPDLAYWYDSIFTTANSGGYTSSFGGTSAAAPMTAGHFGLFFQMWHENAFGNDPTGATVFESRPHATTARAFVINGAERYDFQGAGHDLARVHQGWGRANLANLWDARDKLFFVDETDVLENLESSTYSLVVGPGEPALRVTLVYLDLPGTTSSSVHRINDLTLRVGSPDGKTFWGNRNLKKGNWSLEGGGPNTKDVVENVFVQDPLAGVWTVEVLADEVNADAHVETPEVDADYALVVSGTLGEAGGCVAPLPYCDGNANSTGAPAVFSSSGSSSVSSNDMVFQATSCPPNQPGLYFYGFSAIDVPAGDGRLCVGSPSFRLPVVFADGSGTATFALDLTQLPPGGTIQSGDTTFVQLWYRDPAFGGSGFNFSNGLEIAWCD